MWCGSLGRRKRKVQTGGERDTWHMDPGSLGDLQWWVSNRRTQGHLTYGPDPTTFGSLRGHSGECLIDEHLWHYRDPGRPQTYTTWEGWVPGEGIRTLSYFVICIHVYVYTLSCHVLPKRQTHTCEWDEEGPHGKKAKKSTCLETFCVPMSQPGCMELNFSSRQPHVNFEKLTVAFLSWLFENFMVDLCQAKLCLNQFINQTPPSSHLGSLGLHLFSVVTFQRMELPSLYDHTVAPNLDKMQSLHNVPFSELHIYQICFAAENALHILYLDFLQKNPALLQQSAFTHL